jgi:hypothetical protein
VESPPYLIKLSRPFRDSSKVMDGRIPAHNKEKIKLIIFLNREKDRSLKMKPAMGETWKNEEVSNSDFAGD